MRDTGDCPRRGLSSSRARWWVLAGVLAVLGCGGRDDSAAADAGPGAVGSGGRGALDGRGATSGGAAGTPSDDASTNAGCRVGDRQFAPGDVFLHDCNTCTCSDGMARCTNRPCSCVDRSGPHALDDVLSGTSAPVDGLPPCLPSCGASPLFADRIYSLDALPSGPCDPFTPLCVMSAHEGCLCPNAPGPVDEFLCSCGAGAWSCAIASHGLGTCGGTCYSTDAGANDSGASPSCALTSQLIVTTPVLRGIVAPPGQLSVDVTLTNWGPLDHDALPGILVTSDPILETLGPATKAVAALRSGESTTLRVEFDVPASQACMPITFLIRARSFGAEIDCEGASIPLTTVLARDDPPSNCPACPTAPPSAGAACSPSGLHCDYDGFPAFCNCVYGQWRCGVNL